MGVEIARHGEALAQRRHRRIAAAEPQPVALRHLRPAAPGDDGLELRDRLLGVLHGRGRQASAATPSASGWCASRNRSPARNRCPGSGRSARASVASWPKARPAAMPPPATARPRSTVRRLGWRWSDELVIAVPEAPKTPNLMPDRLLSEGQSAALGKSRYRSAAGIKGGAGQICDDCRDKLGPNAPDPRGRNSRGPGSRRKMVGNRPRTFASEPVEDLVGPEPLEPMQRLVQGGELVGGDAADLLHRANVLLVETLDDVANLAALSVRRMRTERRSTRER